VPHEVVIYKDTKLSVHFIKDHTVKAYGKRKCAPMHFKLGTRCVWTKSP